MYRTILFSNMITSIDNCVKYTNIYKSCLPWSVLGLKKNEPYTKPACKVNNGTNIGTALFSIRTSEGVDPESTRF